jgi:hypothetical protein
VSRLELTDLLKEIAERLTRLMDCHFCAISAYDEQAQTVTMLADYDHSGSSLPDTEDYELSRYPLTRRVLVEKTTAVVNLSDPAADPDELRELVREGDKSLLMVPLVVGDRSIGLLELMDHLRERRYSRQELRICCAIAGQAAVALHNAQIYADAKASALYVQEMGAAVQAASECLADFGKAVGLDDLLAAGARSACRTLGGVSCVASAEDRSAGFRSERRLDSPADRSDAQRKLSTLTGIDILTANDAASGVEVEFTLSLPRPAQAGESQLLGLMAAAVGSHIARMRGERRG